MTAASHITVFDYKGHKVLIETTDPDVDGVRKLKVSTTSAETDGVEALLTTLNTYTDGLETLLTALNALITTQAGYVDGLEGLITSTNTKLDTLHTDQAAPATGAQTSVASSASDGTILASNVSRKGATIFNDSTALLYLLFASGTSSATNYSVQVPAGTQYTLDLFKGGVYTGVIKGIWASANGNARVTELT